MLIGVGLYWAWETAAKKSRLFFHLDNGHGAAENLGQFVAG